MFLKPDQLIGEMHTNLKKTNRGQRSYHEGGLSLIEGYLIDDSSEKRTAGQKKGAECLFREHVGRLEANGQSWN